MDKLKEILALLKKYHFWVLCAAVLALVLPGWYMASSSLADQFTSSKNKISAEFSAVRDITSKTDPPNEKFEKTAKVLTANLTEDVEKAWSLVYTDQKSKVLKWPQELGEDFLTWIDDPDNYEKDIPEDLRDIYLNYVKEEFPNLLKIVDARPYWSKEEETTMGGKQPRQLSPVAPRRRRREQVDNKEYTVIWDKKNQQAIDEQLEFPKGRPDSKTVRYCQENLWVYHALLDAIAKVNEGATGHHNAKIKEIITIEIAKDASLQLVEALAPGKILVAENAVSMGMGAGMEGMAPGAMGPGGMGPMGGAGPDMGVSPMGMPGGMPGGMGMPGMEGAEGGLTGDAAAALLDDKRYVNEMGLPMPAGTEGPKEFKRMPIMMRLYMDQREISKLLVHLANSPLPVDIKQFRMNTKMPGFNRERPSMFGGGVETNVRGANRTTNLLRRDKSADEATQSPYDVAIELHGIIYIFNPPDRTLLARIDALGELPDEVGGAQDPAAAPNVEEPGDAADEMIDAGDEGADAEPGDAEGDDAGAEPVEDPAGAADEEAVSEDELQGGADEAADAEPAEERADGPLDGPVDESLDETPPEDGP